MGKQSIIPLKKGFEKEAEAREFIEKEYGGKFEEAFHFGRTGWQYFIGKDGIDLEDIEGYSSIEFKSETKEELQKLLEMFDVKEEDVIKGP